MKIEELSEIKLGLGLGPIKFGMTREEVKTILGEADDIDSYSLDDNGKDLSEAWEYDEFAISISFDEEDDWKLSTVAIASKEYLFRGKKLIGLDQNTLLKELKSLEISDIQVEDCSNTEFPDHILVEVESLSLNFWLDNGILEEIQWAPLFDENECIIWPK
jgi:hypothetical protein